MHPFVKPPPKPHGIMATLSKAITLTGFAKSEDGQEAGLWQN